MSAFLIALREGAEAAVLVGLLFIYLRALGRADRDRWIWGGVAAAAAVSAGVGAVLAVTVGSLEGRAEEIVEGSVTLLAVAVLTWVVLWMAAHSGATRSRLAGQVESAVRGEGSWGLALVAFAVVVREGLETALFLIASVGSGLGQLVGGLVGLVAAVALGVLVFRGARRFSVQTFFRVTGVLILLFAAGLLVKGIGEFQEANLLPALAGPVWDVSFGHPESSLIGRVATELLGWTPAPSLLQVLAYGLYVVTAGVLFVRRALAPAPPPTRGRVTTEPGPEDAHRPLPPAP